jgi:hypothetical protein
MKVRKTQQHFNVRAILTVGILQRISGQRRHHTDNNTSLDCLGRMYVTWEHRNRTVFATINTILSVVMSSYTIQILEKLCSIFRITDRKHRSG